MKVVTEPVRYDWSRNAEPTACAGSAGSVIHG